MLDRRLRATEGIVFAEVESDRWCHIPALGCSDVDERTLCTLLEGAGDAGFATDQNQTVRYWSHKAEGLLGFRRGEVVGRTCADLLAGVDENGSAVCGLDCQVTKVACRGEAVGSFDVRFATASNGRRWVNVGTLVMRVNRGRTTMVVHFLRDIERRKQMELITRDVLVSVGRLTGQQADALLRCARDPRLASPLTPRETTILRELSLGHNIHQISTEHHIDSTTVRNHIQHILRKLQCHSRLEAVVRAIREGII